MIFSISALYRMTIVVNQPWRDDYYLTNSEKFKKFSDQFEKDLEQLYDSLPGEQVTAVISIE